MNFKEKKIISEKEANETYKKQCDVWAKSFDDMKKESERIHNEIMKKYEGNYDRENGPSKISMEQSDIESHIFRANSHGITF